MASAQVVLTKDDFVSSDFIMVRPAMVRKIGDLAGVLIITRLQFRCDFQHTDPDGFNWWKASHQDISDDTGLSLDQIRRVMKRLIDAKLIVSKIENENPWDRTKSYRVNVGEPQPAESPDASGHQPSPPSRAPMQPAESPDVQAAESPVLLYTQDIEEEVLKTNARDARLPVASLPDLFDEFWQLYPAKKEKIAARKAWARAIKKVTPELIIDAVRRYSSDRQVLSGFIKNPATWLNAGCWDDEPTIAPSSPGSFVEIDGQLYTQRNAQAFDLIRQLEAQESAAVVGSRRVLEIEKAPW